MPKTDEPLDPTFERQLRFALDRVRPPFSAPRYASGSRLTPWRFAPIALAVGITGVMALTVSAASGTVNPAVVVNRISTAIEPAPESTPTPAPTPQDIPKAVAPVQQTSKPEPKETPEPTERPEPAPSPEPGEDHNSESSNPTPPASDR